MMKKSTSGTFARRAGVGRQDKGRPSLGPRGKDPDAVRAQILKNTQAAKPSAEADFGLVFVAAPQGYVPPRWKVSVSIAGGAVTGRSPDWRSTGKIPAPEGGEVYHITYGAPGRRYGKVDSSRGKNAEMGVKVVAVGDVADAVHAIWDQPAVSLSQSHPSSTVLVELGEHAIEGIVPIGLDIAEPIERQFNLDLHGLEGQDTVGREYPGSDEPAKLPMWPAELGLGPYKMK